MITNYAARDMLNTATVAGLVGIVMISGYNTSKHAVIGLTKTAIMNMLLKILE